MNRSFLITIGAFLFIAVVTSTVIFFARGYTFNLKQGKVTKTGILVVTSEPRDAAVYLDGKLQDTTNTTLNFLAPGTYKVRVTKDGFTPWEKDVAVKAELVTRLDLTLFSQVPDLRRLTFSGVKNTYITPDGARIIYEVTEATKKGLWVMSNTARVPFVNQDPIQIYKDLGKIDLTKAIFVPSPDSKTLLVVDTVKPQYLYYLLDLERVNDNVIPIPQATIQNQLVTWHETLLAKERELRERLIKSVQDIPAHESPHPDITPILAALDKRLAQAALPITTTPAPTATRTGTQARTTATTEPTTPQSVLPPPQGIITKITYLQQQSLWSPKQNKVIFRVNDQTKVFDLATGKFHTIPNAQNVGWLSTNLHLILINPEGKKGEIVIADFDGHNNVSIFSGDFVDSIAYPWDTGNRIVVLTNLNQAAGTEPNLYAINLR